MKISTTGTTDSQTGLVSYTYVAETGGNIVQEIPNQTVTEYTITGLNEKAEYVVYMLAYDNAGNIRKSNEVTVKTTAMPVAKMFGQYVDYEVDIDGNTNDYDWQIFYKEEDENSANYGATYIIPDYYVPYSKMTTSITNAGMMLYSGTYKVKFPKTAPSYKTVTNDVRTIFMYDYTGTTNDNAKCVSRMLDTSAWENDFVTNELKLKGGLAIGGPTINMWCASWNKAYPTQKLTPSISGTGYRINGTNSLNISSYTGYISAPNIYFPIKGKASDGSLMYWLSSTESSSRTDKILVISDYSGNITSAYYGATGYSGSPINHGIRPVVYLPPSVTLKKDATTANLWNINYGD